MQKSILFLPFLQIPSGHHQVANALMEEIEQIHPQITCEKIDILAYSYGKIETAISKIYLKWIQVLPGLYNSIYKNSVYKALEDNKRYRLYESLFVYFMKRLLEEKKPDLIVCTHALPAYMVNFLKERKDLQIPAINIYTDYFIHSFWGVEHMDFHFVPSYQMKEFLIKKGVPSERIFVTGIPIHFKFKKNTTNPDVRNASSVLVTGGNLGVGGIERLVEEILELEFLQDVQFFVLCGKNEKLYERLNRLDKRNIIPLPYIDCKEKMNALYDRIDAVLTKPGGVTISESIFKRKPIFIYDALPGQEEINLKQLMNLGVVFVLDKKEIHEQLLSVLQNKNVLDKYYDRVENFHSYIDRRSPSEIIVELLM